MGTLSIPTLALVCACAHSEGVKTAAVPGTPTYSEVRIGVTNPQASNVDAWVVDRLSTTRCDREESCNNVGGGRTYVSRAVCMDQMRGSIANELNTYDCPRGIDREHLSSCMSAIKSDGCGDGLATLARAQACRAGALCIK